VPGSQLAQLGDWYGSVAPCAGLFPVDLAVLADGRLGVLLDGDRPLAVGPRELRAILREAGWGGEDLLLLAQPPDDLWDATVSHAAHLGDLLKVDVWMPGRGAEVWAQPDGTLAADGSLAEVPAWHVVPYGRIGSLPGAVFDDIAVPAALVRTTRPAEPEGVPEVEVLPTSVVPDPLPEPLPELSPEPSPEPSPVPESLPELASDVDDGLDLEEEPTVALEPDAVVLAPAVVDDDEAEEAVSDLELAVPWLPASPVVNHRPLDLYVWTSAAPADIEGWGLPSAELYLLAGQDPLRLAESHRGGALLRVTAPAGSAIDLVEHARDAPDAVRHRLRDSGCTHLLPVAWLGDLDVKGRYDVDERGGVVVGEATPAALAVRFEGAEHGVPGLPNEVVHWPDKKLRADAPSYLLLAESGPATDAVQRGFVALTRQRPELPPGHRLLEVKIRRRRAIDVPATLDRLAGLPVVGRLHDFVGVDVLLSEHDLTRAVVTKIWRQVDGRQQVDKLSGQTLDDVLSAG
jgi:hypothetical protein